MSSPDERQQATAVLLAGTALCLWLSHFVAARWPSLPGTVDLNHWIKVWNRPLIANWPCALILFLVGCTAARRLRLKLTAISLRRQQREAQWISKSLGNPGCTSSSPDDYRPIE